MKLVNLEYLRLKLIFLSLQTLTNAPRDPTHVMKMQTVPIMMVRSNANAKLVFQGMGIHAQVFNRLNVLKCLHGECLNKFTHSCDTNANCTKSTTVHTNANAIRLSMEF